MKLKVLAAAVATALVVIGGTTAADARRAKPAQTTNWAMSWDQPAPQHRVRAARKHSYAQHGHRRGYAARKARSTSYASRANRAQGYSTRIASHGVGGRPRRWCGWWMRTQRGGGPEYNLAWNWRKYGSPSGPQVGAVVVWRHHVGEIIGQTSKGQWIVRSGNDGGRVRERARSVSGAIFRI